MENPQLFFENIARELESSPERTLSQVISSKETSSTLSRFITEGVASIVKKKVEREPDILKKSTAEQEIQEQSKTAGNLQSAAKRILARMRLRGEAVNIPLRELTTREKVQDDEKRQIACVRIITVALADHHLLADLEGLKTDLEAIKILGEIDKPSIEQLLGNIQIEELSKSFVVVKRDIAGQTILPPLESTEGLMKEVVEETKNSAKIPNRQISIYAFDVQKTFTEFEETLKKTKKENQIDVLIFLTATPQTSGHFSSSMPYLRFSFGKGNNLIRKIVEQEKSQS